MQFCMDADIGKSLSDDTLHHYEHNSHGALKNNLVEFYGGVEEFSKVIKNLRKPRLPETALQMDAKLYDEDKAWITCHNMSPERILIVDGWLSGSNQSAPIGLLESDDTPNNAENTPSVEVREEDIHLDEFLSEGGDAEDAFLPLRSVKPEHDGCIVTQLANRGDHAFFTEQDSLIIISIGSESRPHFIETQWNTWASQAYSSCLLFIG